MPAKSKAQQRLMGAAEHGASFPLARTIRETMTQGQMHDFAAGSMKGKPVHVAAPRRTAPMVAPTVAPKPSGSRVNNLGKFAHPKKGTR